jgi:hypothetical protein
MSIQTLFDKIVNNDIPFIERKALDVALPVRTPYVVSQRVILCGSFLEHYEYKSPYVKGMPQEWRPVSKFKRVKPQVEITQANVSRTRTRIRRLVNSNSDLGCFLSLTYRDSHYQDFKKSNDFFENFIKRIRRIYPKFKYLAVPEFQSDYYYRTKIKKENGGNIHYHLLCNYDLSFLDFENDKEVKKFEKFFGDEIWQGGFCNFKKITDIDNVGAYVCKYLGKANFDKRFFGKKKFFYSRNLLKPLVVDKLCEVLELLDFFDLKSLFKKFEMIMDSDWFGRVQYTQYYIKSIKNIFDFNEVGST